MPSRRSNSVRTQKLKQLSYKPLRILSWRKISHDLRKSRKREREKEEGDQLARPACSNGAALPYSAPSPKLFLLRLPQPTSSFLALPRSPAQTASGSARYREYQESNLGDVGFGQLTQRAICRFYHWGKYTLSIFHKLSF